MKKILCCAVFLLCAWIALGGAAEEYSQGYFLYTVTDESVTITGYFGNEENVQVPSTIAGLPVNTIGEGAFVDTGTSSVTLPDTVTTVEENAIGVGVSVSFDTGPVPTPEIECTPAATEQPVATPVPTAKPAATERPSATEKPASTPNVAELAPEATAVIRNYDYEETEDELTEADVEAARVLTARTQLMDAFSAGFGDFISAAALAAMLAVILAVCTLFV